VCTDHKFSLQVVSLRELFQFGIFNVRNTVVQQAPYILTWS